VDTNAGRDFSEPGAQRDLVTSILGEAKLLLQGQRAQLFASYDAGLRRYLIHPDASVFAHAALVEGALAVGKHFTLGVEGAGRDRRVFERDYTDLSIGPFAEVVSDERLQLRLRANVRRFLYPSAFGYSFGAVEGGVQGRHRFTRNHSVVVHADFQSRRYNGSTNSNPAAFQPPTRRRDTLIIGGGSYSYRGPFAASVGYVVTDQSSNSYGESSFRHRLLASLGARLPLEVFALLQGSFQLSHYPDGVFLSPEFSFDVEDENQNTLSVKLVRALTPHVEVELRYGLYHATFDGNGPRYLRHLGWLGLAWRL
jgi:hypothetical protein